MLVNFCLLNLNTSNVTVNLYLILHIPNIISYLNTSNVTVNRLWGVGEYELVKFKYI